MTSLSSTEERKQLLRDYFTEHADIDRHIPWTTCRGLCSMEHVNMALDPPGPDDDEYETYAIPGTGDFVGMAIIIVAFNDATSEEVLRSDAWRLGLLTRLPEATCSKVADRKRLTMIRDWLEGHGRVLKGALSLTFASDIAVGPTHYGTKGLWDLLNLDIVSPPTSIHEALGISAEDYIAFLHTLIIP